MLFLSLLDRKEQSGAAAAHLRALPAVTAALCKPRGPQPATTPHRPSLPSGQVRGLSSKWSRTAHQLPAALCPCPCHVPVPRCWRDTRGGWEQSSELLPCPSDTRAPHTATAAVLTLAICRQHPQAPLRMRPFATASSAVQQLDESAGPARSVQLVATAARALLPHPHQSTRRRPPRAPHSALPAGAQPRAAWPENG